MSKIRKNHRWTDEKIEDGGGGGGEELQVVRGRRCLVYQKSRWGAGTRERFTQTKKKNRGLGRSPALTRPRAGSARWTSLRDLNPCYIILYRFSFKLKDLSISFFSVVSCNFGYEGAVV